MGMNDKHDYEPTKWVDNSEPDIDAEHLNKIESALQEYGASIDELAATGGTAAKVKATDTYGLVVDALGESTAQALIDAIANKVVNELINKNKIVNNLLATDASTVLAGTQGAALDKRLVAAENAVTQLNSEAAKKTTFTLPPGPKTLQFKNSYFCFLLSIQGGVGQLFGDFVVTGYGDGGSNRYHVAKLQYGSNVNIAIGDEGTRSITLTNTSTNAAQCVMLDLI